MDEKAVGSADFFLLGTDGVFSGHHTSNFFSARFPHGSIPLYTSLPRSVTVMPFALFACHFQR
jgi:hypothetical protein